MDTILVSVVALALIIVSTLTLTVSTFQSANTLADAWREMESQSVSVQRTEIRVVTANDYTGGLLDLEVQNEGGTDLHEFPKWDVIMRYQSGDAHYLSYASDYPPGSGEWAVKGIFMADGSPEIFDPNILNPGEVMKVTINPETEIGIGEAAMIVISAPNGVTSQCFVRRVQCGGEGGNGSNG